MNISQSAIDLIIAEEVSSKAYYEKHYTHPEWPGGQSGVTVGIGYDLGYATKTKISQDFRGKVSDSMLAVMQNCAGITGSAAASLLNKVKSQIVIPWNVGMDVFMNRDIPQWTGLVAKTLPNCDLLNPTCLGVLVSLAYNRGAGGFNSSTDRNREMAAIKRHMAAKAFNKIPGELRSMVRIWPNVKGLQGRRRREAALFEKGLLSGSTPEPVVKVASTPVDPNVVAANISDNPVRTPQPKTSTAQNTTAAALTVAGAAGVAKAATLGVSWLTIGLASMSVIAIVGVVWYVWYRNRNPK